MSGGQRDAAEQLRRSMIEAIETFFESRVDAGKTADALNVATAALLIETTRADHEISDDERLAVTRAVTRALGVSGTETAELIKLAEQEVRQSIPLHEFTDLVRDRFSLERKKVLVQALWQVAYSDAELKSHEEYLVRKIPELIDLPRADFIEAKIKAREAFR